MCPNIEWEFLDEAGQQTVARVTSKLPSRWRKIALAIAGVLGVSLGVLYSTIPEPPPPPAPTSTPVAAVLALTPAAMTLPAPDQTVVHVDRPNRTAVELVGKIVEQPYRLHSPGGLALDHEGNLYVNGEPYIIWQEFSGLSGSVFTQGGVYFSRPGSGLSPVNISPNDTAVSNLDLAVSGANVHAIWTPQAGGSVRYRRSIDNGTTFLPQNTISGVDRNPSIAASSSNVLIGGYLSSVNIYRSTNNGATISGPVSLYTNNPTEGTIKSASPTALDGTTAAIAWTTNLQRLMVRTSGDAGANWGLQKTLVSGALFVGTPKVNISGQRVVVSWCEIQQAGQPSQLRLATSSDGGSYFSTPVTVTSPQSCEQSQLAISGNNIHVLYKGDQPGSQRLEIGDAFFLRSTDGGLTFGTPVNLSTIDARFTLPLPDGVTDPTSMLATNLVVSGDNVTMGWREDRPAGDTLYLRHSTDGGLTFGEWATVGVSHH